MFSMLLQIEFKHNTRLLAKIVLKRQHKISLAFLVKIINCIFTLQIFVKKEWVKSLL